VWPLPAQQKRRAIEIAERNPRPQPKHVTFQQAGWGRKCSQFEPQAIAFEEDRERDYQICV
jgi:hypothetical protein